MDDVAKTVRCGRCEQVLDEDPALLPKPPCPACGAVARTIDVAMSDTLTIHESITVQGKTPGEREPFIKQKVGDSFFHKTGRWNERTMIVDVRNDRYFEEIVDGDTGEVLVYQDEPLSEHRGHGDAKRKKS